MEKKLPKGWVETELQCIIERMTNGSSLKQLDFEFENSLPISRIETISNETIDLTKVKYVKADEKDIEKYKLLRGDILLSHINSDKHLGKTAIFNLDSTLIHGINLLLIRAKKDYNSFLLNYYFKHLRLSGKFIEVAQRSVNQSSINQKKLNEFKVLIPPTIEQERIVAKLDTLFAHLETAKAGLEKIPVLLKQFRQAVLTQAVTGKLTEEWRAGKELDPMKQLLEIIEKRKDNYDVECRFAVEKGLRKPTKQFLFEIPKIDEIKIKLPKSWCQTNINFLAFVTKLAGFEYTEHFNLKEEGEVPVVRAQNVQMGRFEDKNRLYLSKEKSDFLVRSQLHGRELLMVFIGAGTGNVCLAPTTERWHLAPNVAKIDCDGVNREYLFYYLQSNLGVENVLSRVKATAQPSLSMETIREIVVLLPDLKEQVEIVSRVEALFAKADAIEEKYKQLKEKIGNLPQAVLAKAFRGEI
jgi:type I restriction enzyme S subunit